MNLILHYNSCQFRPQTDGIYNDRLTNKTPQRTVAFWNLCFFKTKQNKKTCMTQLTLSLNIRKYVLTFRLKRPDTWVAKWFRRVRGPAATQARCRETNEAMLILWRIDIAEAGKLYRKNIRQIPHFINQHDSYRPPCKCHVTQKSRNSSVLTITKGKKNSTWKFVSILVFSCSNIS